MNWREKIKEWDEYFGVHCHLPAAAIRDLFDEIERLREYNDTLETLNQSAKDTNKRLRAALADAEQEIRDLKQKHCPYAPHRGDWCSCGWSRPTDTSSGGTTR